MARGKCWIYKRATLQVPGLPPRILDYSDGTEAFDCENVVVTPGEYPVYVWELPGEIIPIPLNIPRNQVDSIVRTGSIPYADGELQWEFIFGKYKPYTTYYTNKFMDCLPFILVILFLLWNRQKGMISLP